MTDRPRSQHIEIDGARIHVRVSGSSDDTPLLLLHGGLGSSADFATS